jgi:hypothetical protein
MTKRRKFLITSLVLSLGFVGIGFLDNQYRFLAIGVLTLAAVALLAWSLWEGLGRDMTLLTLVLPAFFTASVGIFWFLLPVSIFARLPVVIFYGFGIYSLCLTNNIFTVSAIRTIALLRAAKGVGFLLTLVTSFLVYDTIFSLRETALFTSLLTAVLSFPLFLQGFWQVQLNKKLSREVVLYTAIFSLVTSEIAVCLFFWPVTVVVGSLFLTTGVYVLLGLGQARLEMRLFSETVRDYLMVGILVFGGMFFATHWG